MKFFHALILSGSEGTLLSPIGWNQQAVFFPSGDPETDNIAPSTITGVIPYPGQLGMRTIVNEPIRVTPGAFKGRAKGYQLVQVDSSAATAPYPNAVAWWADKTKYLVTTSASKLGRGRIAGRFPDNGAAGSISPGNYGWIQVWGPGLVKLVDSPTSTPDATGKLVVPSSTDGKADVLGAGTAATYPTLGACVSTMNPAYAGGPNDNTVIVDLDVPNTP